MNHLKTTFDNWKQATNERQKLQWAYAAIALVGLVVAGLIGLVDRALADNLLQVVYGAGVLLVVNFVVWAIMTTFISESTSVPTVAPKKSASRK